MVASLSSDQFTKPFVAAVTGGTVAAAATMFIPAEIIESLTMASGLSELVPATAAPLGDTARALIAFATGVTAMATFLLFMTDRRPAGQPDWVPADTTDFDDKDLVMSTTAARASRPQIADVPDRPPTMPATMCSAREMFVALRKRLGGRSGRERSNGDSVYDFSDIEKVGNTLQSGRDASSRVSILDTRELGEPLPPLDLVDVTQALPARDDWSLAEPVPDHRFARFPADHMEPQPLPDVCKRNDTIAGLLDRLERGLARRKQDAVRSTVAEWSAGDTLADDGDFARSLARGPASDAWITDIGRNAESLHPAARPPLRQVASTSRRDSITDPAAMDDGLRAALKTLRRMSGS